MRDKRNREIKVGSRVSIARRPAPTTVGENWRNSDNKLPLPGFRGRVIQINEDTEVVTIREFQSLACRDAKAEYVSVQYGQSRESRDDAIIHPERQAPKRQKRAKNAV